MAYSIMELVLLIVIIILLFCLGSPNICRVIHSKYLGWTVNEHGYSTPIQRRYKVQSIVKLINSVDQRKWVILENGRHDYLIQSMDGKEEKRIVYQSDICLDVK